jgi:hypothetical protein
METDGADFAGQPSELTKYDLERYDRQMRIDGFGHEGQRRLKGLLGFTPNKNEGRYDHRLRKHIAALATNLYINAKKNACILDIITEIANRLPKERAIYRIQLMILKSLRIAYLLTTNPAGR